MAASIGAELPLLAALLTNAINEAQGGDEPLVKLVADCVMANAPAVFPCVLYVTLSPLWGEDLGQQFTSATRCGDQFSMGQIKEQMEEMRLGHRRLREHLLRGLPPAADHAELTVSTVERMPGWGLVKLMPMERKFVRRATADLTYSGRPDEPFTKEAYVTAVGHPDGAEYHLSVRSDAGRWEDWDSEETLVQALHVVLPTANLPLYVCSVVVVNQDDEGGFL
jgi:hypothetical protein